MHFFLKFLLRQGYAGVFFDTFNKVPTPQYQEPKKFLNWWKMDSGEVPCSGSSHPNNGIPFNLLFHRWKWSIIAPCLECSVTNDADNTLVGLHFSSCVKTLRVPSFVAILCKDWCLNFSLWTWEKTFVLSFVHSEETVCLQLTIYTVMNCKLLGKLQCSRFPLIIVTVKLVLIHWRT